MNILKIYSLTPESIPISTLVIASVISSSVFANSIEHVISLTTSFRAWQGVCVDDSGLYVVTDRDEHFKLNNFIQKFSPSGKFLLEKNINNEKDSQGKFMSFGSCSIINDEIFIPTYNFNGGGRAPWESKVVRLNKKTLQIIKTHNLPSGGVAEGIARGRGGDYYVAYHHAPIIRRFSFDGIKFRQKKEYPIKNGSDQLEGREGYYQSIFFSRNCAFLNMHGPNKLDDRYAPGLDALKFNGTSFSKVQTIKPPTAGSGQSAYLYKNHIYWNDRPNNIIIKTLFDDCR